MKRKQKETGGVAAVCQLRTGNTHPFGVMKGFTPLGAGEERIYREMREAIPVLDAAVAKMVRLCGGFEVRCRDREAQHRLNGFLQMMPCGRGQMGIESFLSGYLDSLLTYGRAVGELVIAGGKLRAVCWGDVTALEAQEGENPLETVLWGTDEHGLLRPLPYQQLLLFTTMNPEPAHPYGVSMFRGMPFLADILLKIYNTIGVNWERAGNIRYSVICKGGENLDPVTAQERGKAVAAEWSRAMEDNKNGTVRDFVAVGDVEIKVIGGEAPILDSETPVRQILEQLVACGAPESILTDAKPHVGTDMLHVTLVNLRRQLLSLGAQVRFGHRVTGLRVRDGALEGLEVTGPEGPYVLPARHAVLALGHSARDTFEMLHAAGVQMEQKPFAVGVRIEHRQSDMDAAQYRQFAGHPCLPAASYKLSCHLENGRSAFSFCVCPGGQVVAAASEQGRVVTNGMSAYARDRENINGGLLVNVTPEDFGSGHPLAGVAFQRQLEEAAFRLGGGGYAAPCQRVEDFLAGRPSVGPGRVIPSYRPGVRWTDLRQCLPEFVWETLALALPVLDRKIQGYAQGDAVLTAVETRSASPVRILRDESGQCSVRGLYPCGEGAGYAGGILSAAADGMRCAEKIWEVYSG